VHVVQKIVDEIQGWHARRGRFLDPDGEAFVHIRYFALRDEAGAYKGVIEVSQNVAGIRALEAKSACWTGIKTRNIKQTLRSEGLLKNDRFRRSII
jgi:hypothetical protein